MPSSLIPHLDVEQPAWANEADRVVGVQQRMQAISQAFLRAVTMGRKSFVLRGLQPTEDRVALAHWDGKLERLECVLAAMGRLTAWAQLRSSGREGSATADELIRFGEKSRWPWQLRELAVECADRTRRDWKAYGKAYDKGAFQVETP